MREIVAAATNLIPLVSEHRQSTEQDRRVAAPIVQAIRESGLGRMLLYTSAPPRHSPQEWLSVLETLAGAEASVSWLVWNTTLGCLWSRFMDDAGRERIFADAKRLYAGSTRPTGQAVPAAGGFRLSGRWSLVSGCDLANYAFLMSMVHEDGAPRMLAPGQPDVRVLFIPRNAYTILDTWHVGGLRGSGSHDIVVDDVFVPAEDTLAPRPSSDGGSPLARLPIVPTMIAGHGAQLLGMARTAMTVAIEILRTKISVDTGARAGDRPSVLADLASYEAAVAAARSHLHACMASAWDASQKAPPTAEDRAALYSAGLHAGATARACVLAMHAAAGTTALYIDCPLERILRDLNTMAQHVAAQPLWWEDSGRVLLGQAPTNPLFMI
jgi:alkylation response protein AidB-like acyl-CoA dehydrogenase